MITLAYAREEARSELESLAVHAKMVADSLGRKHGELYTTTQDFRYCKELAETSWRSAKAAIAELDN